MKTHNDFKTYWLNGALLLLSLLVIFIGCKKSQNSSGPTPAQQRSLVLQFARGSEIQAKAVGIKIVAEGLNARGVPTGTDRVEKVIPVPVFPLNVLFMLHDPPCPWRITAVLDLSRGTSLTASADIDVCRETNVELVFDTHEPFQVSAWAIHAPNPVQAGETIEVTCEVSITAPDNDRIPVTITLSEHDGHSLNGPMAQPQTSISSRFPDPYPVTFLSPDRRTFTCMLSDGHSPDETFTKTIARITPTPTVTPVACAGTLYAGYCWYRANDGESCTSFCASHGGVTDGHIDYTGWPAGTSNNCENVATAVGGVVFFIGDMTSQSGLGCVYRDVNYEVWRIVNYTTIHNASAAGWYRYCSCAF